VASMVAVRTEAWPDDDDDTVKVLFVVTSSGSPTAVEQARKALMEEWGFVVTLINASASQSALTAAAADADVAYISDRLHGNDLNTKLRDAPIGVVNEDQDLYSDFGFSSSQKEFSNITKLDIVDNSHYVTSPFSTGDLTVYSSGQQLCGVYGTIALDLEVLAERTNSSSDVLTVLETGAELCDGGTAAGRRVQLPWGTGSFDIDNLTEDGKTIMKRAIEWAASKEQPE
ncbi:unnamed protein product, partial [marine sediment metagenome]